MARCCTVIDGATHGVSNLREVLPLVKKRCPARYRTEVKARGEHLALLRVIQSVDMLRAAKRGVSLADTFWAVDRDCRREWQKLVEFLIYRSCQIRLVGVHSGLFAKSRHAIRPKVSKLFDQKSAWENCWLLVVRRTSRAGHRAQDTAHFPIA